MHIPCSSENAHPRTNQRLLSLPYEKNGFLEVPKNLARRDLKIITWIIIIIFRSVSGLIFLLQNHCFRDARIFILYCLLSRFHFS